MSLESIRDAFYQAKKNEIVSCELSRRRKLRELYAYTTYLAAVQPQLLHELNFNEPPDSDELTFLEENDISKGRYFRDETLPSPSQPAKLLPKPPLGLPANPPKSVKALASISSSPSVPPPSSAAAANDQPEANLGRIPSETPVRSDDELPSHAQSRTEVHPEIAVQPASLSAAKGTDSPESTPFVNGKVATDEESEDEDPGHSNANSLPAAEGSEDELPDRFLIRPPTKGHAEHPNEYLPSQLSPVDLNLKESPPLHPSPIDTATTPNDSLPRLAEDVAALPTPQSRSEQEHEPHKAAVHLPPKGILDHRSGEVEQAQDAATKADQKEDEKDGAPPGPGDLASSPSSTVGPYSATTPRPPPHSPDTSPDSEAFRGDPLNLRLSDDAKGLSETGDNPSEQDEASQSHLHRAREALRSPSPVTPDAQLQLEEEQATRLARDPLRTAEPTALTGQSPRPASSDPALVTDTVVRNTEGPSEAPDSSATMIMEPEAPVTPSPAVVDGEVSEGGPVSAPGAPGKPVEEEVVAEKSRIPPPSEQQGRESPADVTMYDVETPREAQQSSSAQILPTPYTEPAKSPSERKASRASSALIKHKSVSDILGQTPKPPPGETHLGQPSPASPLHGNLTPVSQVAPTPRTPTRTRVVDRKDRERTKPPTVVFAKESKPGEALRQVVSAEYESLRGASQDPEKDYLIGLFTYQAHMSPRSSPLQDKIERAHKTLSTSNHYAVWRELQDYKLLKRLYQVQSTIRWPLRQLEKAPEPPRPTTHMDYLLAEMKWMRTDFREERKWKGAIAKAMADWCAKWVASDPEQRLSLQVKVKIPGQSNDLDEIMEIDHRQATPELIPSNSNETESESCPEDDDEPSDLRHPPAKLFSLGYGDVCIQVDETDVTDRLLEELPKYEAIMDIKPLPTPPSPSTKAADAHLIPVSKYITGKIVPKSSGPPRKRSRYDYEQEDSPPSDPTPPEHSLRLTPNRRLNDFQLPPEQTNVALFSPEFKHTLDRIRTTHAFRPPSEFAMPSTSFFESRASSQWLWDEDQKLRNLVKEFSFNWSLIASEMSSRSQFTSGAERRTPWECFERWVNLEGLPGEMAKTPYFKTYQARLETAQRNVAQQQAAVQAMQQQAQTSAQPLNAPLRRRSTLPVRVERRRSNRYLTVIDGMRKLARKRESAAHKQQEAQKAAALRKAHEASAHTKHPLYNPQEFSRLKWEREQKFLEKQEQIRQQMMKNAQLQRNSQTANPGQALPPGAGLGPQQRNLAAGSVHGPSPLGTSTSAIGLPQNGVGMQARPNPSQSGLPNSMPNGSIPGVPVGTPGIPQAQMQVNMQQRIGPHSTPESLRMAMQQRAQQQFQLHQQQLSQANKMPSALMSGTNGGMKNPALLAAMSNKLNGAANPSLNGLNGSSTSPRLNHATASSQSTQPQSLSSGHIPAVSHIAAQIRTQNPQLSPDQVRQLTNDHLKGHLYQHRQNALNAAAGASASMPSSHMSAPAFTQNNLGGSALTGSASPTMQYQQQLRQQLLQRPQGAGSPNLTAARPPSRSATPHNVQIQQQQQQQRHPGGISPEQHSPRAPHVQPHRT